MKSIFPIAMLIAGLGICSVAHASDDAANRAATIKSMSGKVDVLREESSLAANEGMELFKQDVIRTADDASAGVCFVDGSRMSLGPNSELIVENYAFEPQSGENVFDVYLRQGTSVYSSGHIGKMTPESIRIATPQTVLSVRGTKMLIPVK